MPRLSTTYAGASGIHRGQNFMSGLNCNDKKQGLPATRNMRTGAILNHVRVQAYAPPADRNRIFNALGGRVNTNPRLPDWEVRQVSSSSIAPSYPYFAGRKENASKEFTISVSPSPPSKAAIASTATSIVWLHLLQVPSELTCFNSWKLILYLH